MSVPKSRGRGYQEGAHDLAQGPDLDPQEVDPQKRLNLISSPNMKYLHSQKDPIPLPHLHSPQRQRRETPSRNVVLSACMQAW